MYGFSLREFVNNLKESIKSKLVSEKLPPKINLPIEVELHQNTIDSIEKNRGDLEKKDYMKIISIVEPQTDLKEETANLLTKLNIPKKQSEEIATYAISVDGDKLNHLLTTQIGKVPLKKITNGNKHNLLKIITDSGFSLDFAKYILDYTWKTTPVMGRGEVALAIFLKDGRLNSKNEKGDIVAGGESVEVKNDWGRLKSGGTLSNGGVLRKHIVKELNTLLKKSEYPLIGNDVTHKTKKGSKNILFNKSWDWKQSWQSMFNTPANTNHNWGTEAILSHLYNQGHIDKKDRINFYHSLLDKYYTKNSGVGDYKWVEKNMDFDGNLDRGAYVLDWLNYSYQYYKKNDVFKHLVVINKDTGDLVSITNNIKPSMRRFLKIYGRVNLTDAGSPMGNAFAIGFR